VGSLLVLRRFDVLSTLWARAFGPHAGGEQPIDRGDPMSERGASAESPVDNRTAVDHSHWSAQAPPDARSADRRRRIAAAWFEPLWEIRQEEAQVHGWRFCCQKRESENYRETYARAYRHLESCEWTDRFGIGSTAPLAF
jgi:hypothetical protein